MRLFSYTSFKSFIKTLKLGKLYINVSTFQMRKLWLREFTQLEKVKPDSKPIVFALRSIKFIKLMIFLLIFAFPSLQTKMYSDNKLYSHFYPRICDGNFFLFPPQIFLLLLLYHHRSHCQHQLHSYWLFTISQVIHMHMHKFYSILTTNHDFYFLHFNSKETELCLSFTSFFFFFSPIFI